MTATAIGHAGICVGSTAGSAVVRVLWSDETGRHGHAAGSAGHNRMTTNGALWSVFMLIGGRGVARILPWSCGACWSLRSFGLSKITLYQRQYGREVRQPMTERERNPGNMNCSDERSLASRYRTRYIRRASE